MRKRRMPTSRTAHTARADIEKRVRQLARSVQQLPGSLRRAEQRIEADARARVRKLRNQARADLAVLHGHQREASRILARLSMAADGSWGDLKQGAERALRDALRVAEAMRGRFRRAVSGELRPR